MDAKPVADGHGKSMTQKGSKKFSRGPVLSAKTKRMLEDEGVVAKHSSQRPTPDKTEAVVEEEAEVCIARTGTGKNKGKRCTKLCVLGKVFCRQHCKIQLSANHGIDQMDAMKHAILQARSRWSKFRGQESEQERWNFEAGVRASFEDDAKAREERERSMALLAPRLRRLRRRRVETVSDGSCQFAALVQVGNLDIDALTLRGIICDTILDMRAHFAPFQAQFEDLDEYVAYMRRPGSYGDHLTLQAAAFYLRRRVMIVSDHFYDQHSVSVVEPALLVAREVWGETIVVAHYRDGPSMGGHYEATEFVGPDVVGVDGNDNVNVNVNANGNGDGDGGGGGGEATPPASPSAEVAGIHVPVLGCAACGEFGVACPEHQ